MQEYRMLYGRGDDKLDCSVNDKSPFGLFCDKLAHISNSIDYKSLLFL